MLELFQRRDVALPQRHVALLLDAQALLVPIACEHGFAVEKLAEARIVEPHAFIVAMRHDVQQRLQRRAGGFDAAVLEIVQRHAPLRFHDGVHARGEQFQALLFRPQHLFGENGVGRLEKPAEEAVDESTR